jgi:DNA polymerase-3 subunit delta'
MMVYPWLQSVYEQLTQVPLRGHAFLLLGPVGLGQGALIDALLTCHLQTDALEDHPDVYRVARLEGKRDISVDQIRQLTTWVQHTAHGHLGRWVVIESLELMNGAAANSLLKTLEEPPAEVRFLLTAQGASKLLPTILSRCQQWSISPPSQSTAIAWLQTQVEANDQECAFALVLHQNAPLYAKDWLLGQGLTAWRTWQSLWQQVTQQHHLTLELIQWANEDPERFLNLLSAQCYVSLQSEHTHFLPLIRLCWHAQQLLRQNASKELLIDQVLQALGQALDHQMPEVTLNHRRGLLAL